MKPVASIIIPAYNAEKTITLTIDALLRQETRQPIEIIVVNDGSTDRTRDVVEKYTKKYRHIFLINQVNKGPAAARNAGAKAAKGEYVIFTDSDCVPSKIWVDEMIRPFEEKHIVGVQGRYKILNPESLMARFVQFEIEERYDRMKKEEFINFIGSYSAAYKRIVFLEFMGFDEDFKMASGEDPELSYRMADRNLKMVFNPKAVVYHRHPESLWKYLKVKFWRGFWGTLLYKKHPSKKFGQSYNSGLYFFQMALTTALIFFAVALFPFSLEASGIMFVLTILSSLPPLIEIGKREKKFLILGLPIIILRNFSIVLGILYGRAKLKLPKKTPLVELHR